MKVTVVKIGGNIVDNPAALELFLKNFQKLEGPKVLIHGGGAIASQLSKKLGLEVKMHTGRQYIKNGLFVRATFFSDTVQPISIQITFP